MQRPKDKSLPGTCEDEKSPGWPEPTREKQELKLEMQEAGYDVGPSKPVTGSEKSAARINMLLRLTLAAVLKIDFWGRGRHRETHQEEILISQVRDDGTLAVNVVRSKLR